VNRQRVIGVRDYAILLLLVTYGLRAREVAALQLDDIDWRQGRLRIPQRKAGHSSAFPLVTVVGEALVDYLERGRPSTSSRAFFLRGVAPLTSMTYGAVSLVARRYLRKAGIDVPRPGSHTLRHSCAQRLLDAQVSLKEIGDYLGHRTATATEIYIKVDIESLREIALGEGETIV
jgi:integrase